MALQKRRTKYSAEKKKYKRKRFRHMKKTAKLLAILLAVFLGMTVIAPLFTNAAPDGGTLTIHKFIMDDLRNSLKPNDGNVLSGDDLEALDDLISAGYATPKPGVTFKVYKLVLPGPTTPNGTNVSNPNPTDAPWGSLGENPAWEDIIKAFNNVAFTLDNYESPSKIILTKSTGIGSLDEFILEWVDDGANGATAGNEINDGGKETTVYATLVTDSNGVKKSGELSKGLYLVVEQPDPAATGATDLGIASMSFPFLVAVPMTNAEGNGWITDVHCYPKNGDIEITKDVDRNAVHVGETVTWTVDVSVPQDIMHYVSFYLTDQLDEALDYVPGSLKVYALEEKLSYEGEPLPAATFYQIPATGNWKESYTARLLKVDFIDSTSPAVNGRPMLFGDFDKNGEVEEEEDEFYATYVRFVFKTTVNEEILNRANPGHLSYTLENEAIINFQHRYDNKGRIRKSNKPKIHSAAIIFNKLNAHTGEDLIGAGFQIATTETKALAGNFLKLAIDDKGTPSTADDVVVAVLDIDTANGYPTYFRDTKGTLSEADDVVYYYDDPAPSVTAASFVKAVKWEEFSQIVDADVFFSDDASHAGLDGKAIVRFEGLKEFANKTASAAYKSYWVVETQAPQDFNLLLEPIRITFDDIVSVPGNWYTLNGGVINNTNTFVLPRTGGIGTILFTAGGIALIGVAAVLLVLGAKKKKQKNAA